MKKLVQHLLAWKTKKILARHKPTIVAVSGSVGKTSTRNAIAAVLGGRFRVRFDDFTGKAFYHCHILDHDDMGMMGVIEVVA